MRVIKAPKRYGITDFISYALVVANEVMGEEPENFNQVMNNKDKSKWLAAKNKEIASLKKNHTWIVVKKPLNKKLVGCKWIFKLKKGTSVIEPLKYKAGL